MGVLLQGVIVTGKIKSEETVSKNEFKTSWNNELKLDSWKEKRLHGQFLREIPGTTHVRKLGAGYEKQTRRSKQKHLFVQARNRLSGPTM